VAKHIPPSDFYITCATVIPVLFLAIAVQGKGYQSVLQAALKMTQLRYGERWERRLMPLILGRFLKFTAYGVLCAGALGEILAISVLYQGYEQPWDRKTVALATLVLVIAVAVGPFNAYLDARKAIDDLTFPPPKPPPAHRRHPQSTERAGTQHVDPSPSPTSELDEAHP
jgi:hypothetical protein